MHAAIVIAESFAAFEWWCSRNNVDPGDRRRAVPLVTFSDKFRLNKRNVTGCRVVKVGNILKVNEDDFMRQLKFFGYVPKE